MSRSGKDGAMNLLGPITSRLRRFPGGGALVDEMKEFVVLAGQPTLDGVYNELKIIKRFIGLWNDFGLRTEHPEAMRVFHEGQKYKYNLTEYESRLQECVDYFGYEKGSKAPYCRIYGGESTPLRDPDAYGMTKRLGELMLAERAPGLSGLAMRLPGVVGPGAQRNWLAVAAGKIKRGEKLRAFNLWHVA
jgi:hypothetical protein